MQGGFTFVGAAALLITVYAIWADRRRGQRRDIEAVGIVPWGLVTVLGTLVALFGFAFAIVGVGK